MIEMVENDLINQEYMPQLVLLVEDEDDMVILSLRKGDDIDIRACKRAKMLLYSDKDVSLVSYKSKDLSLLEDFFGEMEEKIFASYEEAESKLDRLRY